MRTSPYLSRFSPLAIIFSALILAGCAHTQPPTDTAEAQALLDQLQEEYRYTTQADPLGAYLANRGKSDVAVNYSQSRTKNHPAPAQHQFANAALDYLGVKYKYGGNAPSSGFDCSGLIKYVAEKSLGLKLPRTSAALAQQGKSIKKSHLQKGDLVFFNTSGKRYSHVGIYLGDNKFVHAPSSGSSVRVEDMTIAYWNKRYTGARRLASAQ